MSKFKLNIAANKSCNRTCFNCGNGTEQCIPWHWVCDGDQDCTNGNDETRNLCQNSGECGGKLTTSSGILTSPSYPQNYPENTDCVYTISQPIGTIIIMNLVSMDIEQSDSCNYDYIEIRNGLSEDSPVLQKLCGNEVPAPIQSVQNHMWMK